MLTPSYAPSNAAFPDVYGAVTAFVAQWAQPPFPAVNIYWAWGNRESLPADTNEYAVISVRNTGRRGTGTEDILNTGAADDEPEQYQIRTWYEVLAQVDFCSDDEAAAYQRAYSIETIMRSSVGVNFFKAYEIAAQYADDIQELSALDESDQYVYRYAVTLHLGYWVTITAQSSWFDTVTLNRVEDVDAHHPPTE